MQRKRIVIAGPAHPYRGGLAAFNERLARALQEAGHEVIIYTFTLQYPSFLFPGKSQFTNEPPPGDLKILRKINSVNPLNWISTGMELKKMNADVILFRFWIPFIGPCLGSIAHIIKQNRKTKVIGLLDNVIPHEKRPGDRILTGWFLKKCDGFIVMSKQVLQELKSFVPHPVVRLMPHPLYDYGEKVSRLSACQYLNLDPAKKILLFFGFIRGYKGLDLLLDAFSLAVKHISELHLVIAGEFYEDEKPYLEKIHAHQLNNKVTLRKEYIPDAEVRYYFSAADLVVQPYKSATQSGISQMAFHFEKPMVVTNVGGLPEIVQDGIAGYVTKPEPAAISNAIVKYFREERADTFTEGVRQEKARYHWDHFVKGFEDLATALNQ
jgi:D-inositol-3-phosphate glycosyltransferase